MIGENVRACFENKFENIASTSYKATIKGGTKKVRACWFTNSKHDEGTCKVKTYGKEDDEDKEYSYLYFGTYLNEKIVTSDYKKNQNYFVSKFPVFYSLHDRNQKGDNEKDSRHYRVSGHSFAKAYANYKREKLDGECDDKNVYLCNKEPSDDIEKELVKNCNHVAGYSLESFYYQLNINNEDYQKGKNIGKYTNFKRKCNANNLFENAKGSNFLFTYAVVAMVIQCVGVICWAVGAFVPGGKSGVASI